MKKTKKKTVIRKFDDEGFLCFSREDLSSYELSQYRYINSKQAEQILRMKFKERQRQHHSELESIAVQIRDQESASKTFEKALLDERKRLEKNYNVDMNSITYDDLTGRVFTDSAPVTKKDR